MNGQQGSDQDVDGAGASFPATNALLLSGMTRSAAVAECVILLLWLVVEWWFSGWYARAAALGPYTDFMGTRVLPSILAAAVAVGLGVLLLRLNRSPRAAIGLRGEGLETQVLWGIGAALATYAVILAWTWGSFYGQWWLWNSGHGSLSWLRARDPWARLGPNATVGAVLILWVAVAIGEEVLYCGLVLPRLRRVAGRWWPAVLATSLLFAVGHLGGGPGYALSAFLGSILWCLVFIWSRSLLTVVVGHFLFNSAAYMHHFWLDGAH